MAFALVLNSCGSSLTVTKRHHNKGYYISFNKLKKSHDKEVSDDKLVLSDEEFTYDEIVPEENEVNTVASVENTENEYVIGSDNVVNEESNEIAPVTKKNSPQIQKNEVKQSIPTVKELKKIKSTIMKEKKASPTPPREDALSIFWIVILIVLLLWLLGFIFNVGALIHLLLVVALILLILWLLGVI